MTVDKVGAAGKGPKKPEQPGLITEHQAKQQKVNADPKQKPSDAPKKEGISKKQEASLLNDPFYKALGVELTTFDEEGNATALEESETSYDVLKLEIAKTERQRQLLEVDLPQLKIEHVKGWFDETKAIPRTDSPEGLTADIDAVKASGEEVEGVVGKRYHTETNDQLAEAVGNITDDTLFNMINKSDYDDAQKEKLKAGLEDAYSKKMTELAKEFGISVDTKGLADLKKDGTREDVEKQLEVLNRMIAQMPTDEEFEKMVTCKRVNIEAHIGVDFEEDPDNRSRVGALVDDKFAENDNDPDERTRIGEKRLKKTLKELGKLQEADIEDYVKMKKLELLRASMGKVRAEVVKLRDKLDAANEELKQMEAFEETANTKRDGYLATEVKDYKVKVKDARDKRIATEIAFKNDGVAEQKDKNKSRYKKRVEENTEESVQTAHAKYLAAQEAEKEALKQKRIAGFAKNQSHVARYIDHFFETKEIDKAKKDELKTALESFKDADADKFELLADWIKFDDQSGQAIRKKAQTNIKTDTKMKGINPDELLHMMKTVKDMDLGDLKTVKQKKAAKELIEKELKKYQNEAKANAAKAKAKPHEVK